MAAARSCLSCGAREVLTLLDFGPQPPSNRFMTHAAADEDRHRLAMGQCGRCALLQLIDPMPVDMVRSRFPWLTYNEPEGHLDALIARLAKLPGITSHARIVGLTYKDDSSLARFNRLGFGNTYRFDPARDLGVSDAAAGLETIQGAITEQTMKRLSERRERADLLLARHVLEHGHDPGPFLAGLLQAVKPGGYLVFEMPDSLKFLGACDYVFVWEEHITYFTPTTLKSFFVHNGLANVEVIHYPYALEDSLVAIVRSEKGSSASAIGDSREELALGRRFGENFNQRREAHREYFARLGKNRRIAIFGAGHLATKFINLFGLSAWLQCVIDDNPNKQSLLMPGSKLPIKGSEVLGKQIDVCLLALSPESERKVISAKSHYTTNGGEFRSIFVLSPLHLPI